MTAGSSEPAFFDKTYQEAIALTEEAYACIAALDRGKIDADTPIGDLRVRGEAFRLTTRLTQIVAWLMTQRAVQAGELSPSEVAEDDQHRLGARRVCRDDSHHRDPSIPAPLADLLDRSLNLYMRVERLDDQLHRNIH